ncbi:hepatic and glial cell adhesion molecule-like isoform X2 [Struthio camelus]|uniref:hepatic and glial cell adhesion molecule-like isoform X2 n=1 Tax=Struthio camelus TaxID=8801 RepID=UPI003603D5FD
MSTPLRLAVAGYLFLTLLWTSVAEKNVERRVVAEGSSVLLYAPDIKNVNLTEWEYINNSTSEFILQYYADLSSPTIYSAYQGRVIFFPKNGSLLLQKLQEKDSGIYKATVDLMQDKARTTFLEVIKPVPQPELQCSSSLAGSPIELLCVVPKERANAISWKKDGRPLPLERCYQLSENITVLRIRKGEKVDCGSYSCNVSNVISWKEAVLNLKLAGLSPPLRHAQRMTAVALMFAAGSAIGFIVLCCQTEKQGFGKEVGRWMTVAMQGLVCISSLLLLATSIVWMQQEGPSAAFILLGLFLFATIIALLITATLVHRPAALNHFKTKTWHHVIQVTAGPTAAIVLMLFANLLLHNIQQLHERGCSKPVDLTASFILAAAVTLFTLLAFLWYDKNKKNKKILQDTQEKTRGTTTSVQEELQGQNQEEE